MPIHSIIAPRGGLRFDLAPDLISDVEMGGGQNVFFEDGLIKKKYGYKTMGSNLPLESAIIGTDEFVDYAGNSSLLILTTRNIYKWDGTAWNAVSDAEGTGYYGRGAYGAGYYGGGGVFSGGITDYFSSTQIRDSTETEPWWICTNGVDTIKKYTGSGVITDLLADPSALFAKYAIAFKDYLVLLDTTEEGFHYPQRVRWSDTADPSDFDDGNASYWDSPGADWIKGAAVFKGDHLVICKEHSVWLAYATGEDDVFNVDQIVSGQGCSAGRTIKNLPDEILFMGWDDVYSFNGIDIEPIGTKVQRQIFESINPKYLENAFAMLIDEQKEYWLFIPMGSNIYSNIAWCFHYDLRTWSRHTFNDFITISCFGAYGQESSKTFDDLAGSFDSQRWRYDDRTVLELAPVRIFGDSLGNVYQYDRTVNNEDGETVDGYFITKAFNFTNQQVRQLITRMDIMSKHSGLDVSYSTDMGDSWTLIKSLGVSNSFSPQKLSFRVSCNTIMFRFRNNSSDGHFQFNRANIHWQPAGRI